MHSGLWRVLQTYFTEPSALPEVLESHSVGELRAMLLELVDMYANDLNSSSLRELVTLGLAGYESTERKLGVNGVNTKTKVTCEVKPVNIRSERRGRLNGGGNFSDLTPERVREFEEKGNTYHILASGFVDGRLVYVIEFPYPCIEKRIGEQVERRFPGGKRNPGEYLRSAGFSYTHYANCPNLQVVYVTKDLEHYQSSLTRGLLRFLQSRGQL